MEHINTQNGIRSIIQKQIHSSSINIVDRNTPLWQHADAMITTEENLALVTFGADCCIIAFWKEDTIGVCHAGWPGYAQGLVKKMAKEFAGGCCFVGPFLHKFEIKKDHAYKTITEYSGTKYIQETENLITFDFQSAIRNELAGLKINEDPRCTFDTADLASRRRDGAESSKIQNKVVILRVGEKILTEIFRPKDDHKEFFRNLTLQE